MGMGPASHDRQRASGSIGTPAISHIPLGKKGREGGGREGILCAEATGSQVSLGLKTCHQHTGPSALVQPAVFLETIQDSGLEPGHVSWHPTWAAGCEQPHRPALPASACMRKRAEHLSAVSGEGHGCNSGATGKKTRGFPR